MTFADAVSMLSDGMGCKRPGWGGYVFRTNGSTTGEYSLTYRKRANSGSSAQDYVYSWQPVGGSTSDWHWVIASGSSATTLDVDLHAAMLATDWMVASTSDLEAARTGTGTW